MKKDIVNRIDEILGFAVAAAVGGANAKPMKDPYYNSSIRGELSSYYGKVMAHPMFRTKPKVALKETIKKLRLNKNWTKLLKRYFKEMTR